MSEKTLHKDAENETDDEWSLSSRSKRGKDEAIAREDDKVFSVPAGSNGISRRRSLQDSPVLTQNQQPSNPQSENDSNGKVPHDPPSQDGMGDDMTDVSTDGFPLSQLGMGTATLATPDHFSLASQDTPTHNPPNQKPASSIDSITRPRRMKSMASVDDADRGSVYSLIMETDFRYYFQHPYLRLFFAYFVTFLNFLIYAEDPVAHSEAECFIPVVGNCFAFVSTRYPDNAWIILKVFVWGLAVLFGLVVGKIIIHKLVFNRLFRLKMFCDDQGSWMTMFFTVIFFLFLFSHIYNLLLLIGGEATVKYRITEYMGIKNSLFMKAACCGTWCGDFFTAWMVTDVMLQEKLYPHWAPRIRKWWNKGWNRIILFWIMTGSMSTIVVTLISTDGISWDRLNHDFLPSNEVSRAYLASFILVLDLIIVMQDWDFPYFVNSFDLKLPGLNTAHIKFRIPRSLRKEQWYVHITGKWFNYGIIFIVMILDLNMWKNQIFFSPYEYGQYLDSESKIHTVKDQYSLDNHNRTYLNFEFRNSTINPVTNETYIRGDMVMNSRWYGYPLAYKCTAFIPSMMAFLCFGVSIWYFGRWVPTKDDPYAGRVKKRKKLSFSARFRFRRSLSKPGSEKSSPKLKAVKEVSSNTAATVMFDGKEGKDYVRLETDDNNANGIKKVAQDSVEETDSVKNQEVHV